MEKKAKYIGLAVLAIVLVYGGMLVGRSQSELAPEDRDIYFEEREYFGTIREKNDYYIQYSNYVGSEIRTQCPTCDIDTIYEFIQERHAILNP